MVDARITELLDRSEILDVFARYALGMDRCDRELFASAWAVDAIWTCKEIGLDVAGKDAIMAYFDRGPGAAVASPAEGSALRLAANHHIRIDGDRATSVAEQIGLRYTGYSVHPYSVGYYDDEFVRTPDGWRLARRDMVVSPIVRPPSQSAAVGS